MLPAIGRYCFIGGRLSRGFVGAWLAIVLLGGGVRLAAQDTAPAQDAASPITSPDMSATAAQAADNQAGDDAVEPRPPGIPIEPDANAKAWRREVMTIGLMFIMGIGSTILAFLAVWMLSGTPAGLGASTETDSEVDGSTTTDT